MGLCEKNCEFCPVEVLSKLKERKVKLETVFADKPLGHPCWYISVPVTIDEEIKALDFWMTEKPDDQTAECFLGMIKLGIVNLIQNEEQTGQEPASG